MSDSFKAPEVRPEIVFVFELMQQLAEGRLRIPRFQRPFVWRPQQMIDLLDSISRQYPIGSLLAWETTEDIVSLDRVGPIRFEQRGVGTAAYVLDGHQRLSTLAAALIGDANRTDPTASEEDRLMWSIYFNARERTFEHIHPDAAVAAYHFPMSKMLDTFEFLRESQRVIEADRENGQVYVERIQEVARSFQNYKVPVIQIKQTGLSEAVEIFARLNSRGQSMTADQMVSALLYRQNDPHQFDLATAITDLIDLLDEEGFGEIDRTLILRLLLAAVGEDIYRTDWTRVAHTRREQLLKRLRDAVPRARTSLLAAVEFLKGDVHVTTTRLLPYGMQMTVLAAFFYAQPTPSTAQRDWLRRWFWMTSFCAWFGGANPSRVNALVRDFMDRLPRQLDSPHLASVDLETPAVPIPKSFDMRSARTRALLLMLFDLQPLGPRGHPVERVGELVRVSGPKALGHVAARVDDADMARSPANRLLRVPSSERGQARNWLLNVAPDVKAAVWRSHALPIECEHLLHAPDASGFLRARLRLLMELERTFMVERQITPPLSDIPAAAAADSEVDDSDQP